MATFTVQYLTNLCRRSPGRSFA